MSFNAYEVYGSLEETAKIAADAPRSNLNEVRAELFFKFRAARALQSDACLKTYEELLPLLERFLREASAVPPAATCNAATQGSPPADDRPGPLGSVPAHGLPAPGGGSEGRTDWFQQITGFREESYARTRELLAVDGNDLVSRVNGSRHGIGDFELVTLGDLRDRAGPPRLPAERTTVRNVVGDVRRLHSDPGNRDALFQVASQFNLLEMVHPGVTPADGVTGYSQDRTQGPACAIAAGAATIWRNYFVPVGGKAGQTPTRQLNALGSLGQALSQRLGRSVDELWTMRNGYAMCTLDGLAAIGQLLRESSPDEVDRLRSRLAIGLQRGAEVTDMPSGHRHRVSQAFCSGLPVGYQNLPNDVCEPFARLILEGSYEATLRAASEAAARGGSPRVLLTRVGGGVFGNDDRWIDDAIERALALVKDSGLKVDLVSHDYVHPSFERLERRWVGPSTRPQDTAAASPPKDVARPPDPSQHRQDPEGEPFVNPWGTD